MYLQHSITHHKDYGQIRLQFSLGMTKNFSTLVFDTLVYCNLNLWQFSLTLLLQGLNISNLHWLAININIIMYTYNKPNRGYIINSQGIHSAKVTLKIMRILHIQLLHFGT